MNQPLPEPHAIIVFDGVCNLCSASVQFIIARDTAKRFRFASRQSPVGQELMGRHGLAPDRDDSIVLIEGDRAWLRSSAALRIARRLRWPWPILFGLILVPPLLRDYIYDRIAASRYRWFGRSDTCMLPNDSTKDRFLT